MTVAEATKPTQRNWTSTGAAMVARLGGRREVAAEAGRLEWQTVPEGGSLTVGFMPGEAINAAIRELRIPKVSAVAISGFERPAASPDEDGFYPGFYGIEGNYKNGRARVYVLDLGTCLQPLFSDFWEVAS